MNDKPMFRRRAVITATIAAGILAAGGTPAGAIGQQPVFPPQTPAIGLNPDDLTPPGRIELFAVDGNGKLWHNWENSPGSFKDVDARGVSTGFSGWDGIGGDHEVRPGVSVITREDGRLQVYARGVDNTLKEVHQTNFGIWSTWRSLGGSFLGNPVAVRANDNRQVVYVRGLDDAAWMFRSRGPNSDDYDLRRREGGTFKGDPSVLRGADGLVNVFVRGMDDRLYRFEETNFDSSTPRWQYGIGSVPMISKPAPVLVGSRFRVFFVNQRHELVSAQQISDGTNPTWANLVATGFGIYGDPAGPNSSFAPLGVWTKTGSDDGILQFFDGTRQSIPPNDVNTFGSPGALDVTGTQHVAAIEDDSGHLYYCARYPSGNSTTFTGFREI